MSKQTTLSVILIILKAVTNILLTYQLIRDLIAIIKREREQA